MGSFPDEDFSHNCSSSIFLVCRKRRTPREDHQLIGGVSLNNQGKDNIGIILCEKASKCHWKKQELICFLCLFVRSFLRDLL